MATMLRELLSLTFSFDLVLTGFDFGQMPACICSKLSVLYWHVSCKHVLSNIMSLVPYISEHPGVLSECGCHSGAGRSHLLDRRMVGGGGRLIGTHDSLYLAFFSPGNAVTAAPTRQDR